MKKLLLKGFLIAFISLTITNVISAQRYITNTYGYTCYNYFDDNTVDNTNNNNTTGVYAPGFSPDPNVAANNTSVVLSSAAVNGLSLTTGRCLQSKYQATPKAVYANFIPNATDAAYKSINSNDWEWSFLYRSDLPAGTYPSNPPTNTVGTSLTANTNSWRYWLFANKSTISSTTGGFFVTQNNVGKLVLYAVSNSGFAAAHITSDNVLDNGKTYCIKIQRLVGGSWRMYLNEYSASVTQAKTMQTEVKNSTDGQSMTLTYATSALEALNTSSAANNGAFKFDEMHMYTRYLKFTNVTSANYGVTQSPFYANQGNVILWGTKLEMRGNYELGINQNTDLTLSYTQTNNGLANFANSLVPTTLYRTTDSVFSIASPTTVLTSNLNFYSGGTAQTSGGFSSPEVTMGNNDGTLSVPSYWFIGTSINSTVNVGSTLVINGVASVKQNINNNAVTGTVVFGTASPSTTISFADVWDWTGANASWNSTANAWKKNGTVTTSNPQATTDIVRIGYIAYTGASQPTVNVTRSIGQLIFGTNNSPSLTVASGLTVNDDLIFNANSTATLTLSNVGVTVNDDVIVNSSATVNINGSNPLTIKGDFSNATGAKFTSTANTVNFSGTSAQTISNSNTSTTPTVKFKNLTFSGNNTKTFGTGGYFSVASTGILTLSGSSTILSIPTATHLQLLASTTNALEYAQIETIPSGCAIKGNIDYQVYFQGNDNILYRNYRSMGAPVYNNTTTYSSTNGSYLLSDLKNTFIITGKNGATNGFDASSNNGATLKTYNSSTDDYTFITSLNTNPSVTTGTGFYMYFRGDRVNKPNATTTDPFGAKTNKLLGSGGNTYASPESVLLNYTGIPNQGDVTAATIPSTSLFGPFPYYFISNPYPATLDFTDIWSPTYYGSFFIDLYYISSTFWTWSPTAGAYAYYDADSGASNNGGKRYIVPGQGFFVQNTNLSGSTKTLKISESMKATGNNSGAVRFLTTGPTQTAKKNYPITRLQLYKSGLISDEVSIVLSNTSKDSLELSDAPHINGDFMNLTTITPDNKYLAIDKRPFTGSKKIIPLFVNVAVDSIYTFKNTMNNTAMSNYKVTLYDSLINNSVDIVHNDYKFTITRSNAATYGGKRFKLIIEAKPAPVTYFAFEGKLTDTKKGLLTWQTNIYREGTTYQLQRSQDNVTFNDVSTARTGVEGTPKNTFEILDNDIQAGKNYYRLVQTDVFNNKTISNTVMLNVSAEVGPVDIKNGFKLYPNPVSTTLSVIGDKTYGKVTMRVYDSMSNVLSVKAFSEMIAFQPMSENVSQLKLGVYFVELRDSNNNILTTLKFIKQ